MRGPRGETDGNEDKEVELGRASASGSAEAPPSLVGHRCVIDRLLGDGKKEKVSKELLARSAASREQLSPEPTALQKTQL